MSGQRGQTSAEYAGVLVLIAAIVFALATGDVRHRISDTVSDIACRIAGQNCDRPVSAEGERPQIQTAGEGPALAGGEVRMDFTGDDLMGMRRQALARAARRSGARARRP
jgi:hypothetical protein